MNFNKILLALSIGILLAASFACTKFVEVEAPITSTNGENIYNEDGTAIAALTGIYTNMSMSAVATTEGWLKNVCFTTGLAGDELKLYNPTANANFSLYYENSISPIEQTWSNTYKMIFVANSALEKLPASTQISEQVKKQLQGEARFIRAICYFYLVNLYGDVPLILSTDYKTNSNIPRTPVSDVYRLLIQDLILAKTEMNEEFVAGNVTSITDERVRPNKWAAAALLSRIYLYTENYISAEKEATEIINHTSLFKLVDLDDVFLKNNSEAIWQLQSLGRQSDFSANTDEGRTFKLSSIPDPTSYIAYLNEKIVTSFEKNDRRLTEWISFVEVDSQKYYYPNKYKVGFFEDQPTIEYSTVLRLAEQYLIRAEARIKQGNVTDGISDLNILRKRASVKGDSINSLPDLPLSVNSADALKAVEQERLHELFTEWGHRWLDLKRTNRIDDVLKLSKTNYQITDKLFPLPQSDVAKNPQLTGHQNPGYN